MQIRGIIAQLEERMLHTHEVTGSSPVGPIPHQQLAAKFFARMSVFRSGCHWVPRICERMRLTQEVTFKRSTTIPVNLHG